MQLMIPQQLTMRLLKRRTSRIQRMKLMLRQLKKEIMKLRWMVVIQFLSRQLTSRVPMQLLQNRWQRTWRLMNLILLSRVWEKHWKRLKLSAAKPAQNPMNLTSVQQTCMKQMKQMDRRQLRSWQMNRLIRLLSSIRTIWISGQIMPMYSVFRIHSFWISMMIRMVLVSLVRCLP